MVRMVACEKQEMLEPERHRRLEGSSMGGSGGTVSACTYSVHTIRRAPCFWTSETPRSRDDVDGKPRGMGRSNDAMKPRTDERMSSFR